VTDKSICGKCLMATKVRMGWNDEVQEEEIFCRVDELKDVVWRDIIITECSQFLEATRERVEKLESVK